VSPRSESDGSRLEVRAVQPDDRPWIDSMIRREWAGDVLVAHGEVFRPAELPGFISVLDGSPVGLVTYRLGGADCEIVSINSDVPGRGVGTALVEAVAGMAWDSGCGRLWLVTTNDNLDALRFYQRRGFRLAAIRPGAVDLSRALKPEIPSIGAYGIPIRDEVELERML
jgi:GNAT superfamily N-acetyltransferase